MYQNTKLSLQILLNNKMELDNSDTIVCTSSNCKYLTDMNEVNNGQPPKE